METLSTVFKALDVLTIVTAHEDGMSLPDLALALNQPRSNVVRLVRTLQQYGFVASRGRQWVATGTFRAWSAPTDRHAGFRRRYRRVLERVAAGTGELVALGLHEGNGVIHLDAIEGSDHVCRAPIAEIRHSLRTSAMGKLALSRRCDLAAKVADVRLQRELTEIRETGVAWSRGECMRGIVTLAMPGFSNLPTEPMLAISWPEGRFSAGTADAARDFVARTLHDESGHPTDAGAAEWPAASDQEMSILSVG